MELNKPKKLILCTLPTNKCNLQCKYCYISQMNDWDKSYTPFKYSVDIMVKGFSRKRLGGTAIINLTGEGETLLQPNIVELVVGLLKEGHYIEIVTNGIITKRIKELVEIPLQYAARIEYKISFHYDEMIRLGILDKFWSNIEMIKNSPSSFSLELMPNDDTEARIDEIIEVCKEKVGEKCHLTVGRKDTTLERGVLTNHTEEEYFNIWSKFDSTMFQVKKELVNVKRKEFCYAGAWSLCVNLATGEARQCYGQPVFQNIFENVEEKIKFIPVGYGCVQPFCINGHAFLAWGCIPELKIPSYDKIRNRKCEDGTCWLKQEWLEFSKHKLAESNKEYSKLRKFANTMGKPFLFLYGFIYKPDVIINNIKKLMRKMKQRDS